MQSSELPPRSLQDVDTPYSKEDYVAIFERTMVMLTIHSPLKVVAMYKGPDGRRQYGNCVVLGVDYDAKAITLKNGKGDVVSVTGPDNLFFYTWGMSGGVSGDGERTLGTSRASDVVHFNASVQRLTEQQTIATEAHNASLQATLALKAREKALRTFLNTHVGMAEQFIESWTISDDDMKKFPRLLFPPRTFDKASAGYNTSDVMQLLAQILHEALKIMSWRGPEHAEQRKQLCAQLEGNMYVTYIILFWMGSDGQLSYRDAWVLAVEQFIARHKEHHKLRLKLFQAHVVGPHTCALTDEDAITLGIKPDIRGQLPGLPVDTTSCRNGLLLKLTKANGKDVKLSSISPYTESVTISPPASPQLSPRKKKKKGGAPASSLNVTPVLTLPIADEPADLKSGRRNKPVRSYVKRGSQYVKAVCGGGGGGGSAKEGGDVIESKSKTKRHDMRPGARIRDVVLDLVIRGVVAAYQFDGVVLFPDEVRSFVEKKKLPGRSVLDSLSETKLCFAPLLVQGDHWVLLCISSNEIRIIDSARAHTKDDASQLAYRLKQKVHELRGASVVTDRQWPQQDFGSADCALFVARAVLCRVSGMSNDEVMRLLSRNDIDSMLPPSAKDFKKSLGTDVVYQFYVRMADYLKRPRPPPPLPSLPRTFPESEALPIANVCRFGEHLGPGATCGASLDSHRVILCSSCKAKFCAKHATSWNDKATWKCQRCRPPSSTKGMQHDPTDHTMPLPSAETIAKAEADFLSGQESPLLAHQAGNLLDALRSLKEINLHPLARKGVSQETRSDHQRMLRLLAEAPVYQRTWPVARVALDALERGRLKFKWSWQTMGTKMGRMEGALSRLPLYTQEKVQPVLLRFMQEWKDAVSHNARLTAQFRATGLPAATLEDIEKAISTAPTECIKALLILSWSFVARVGDMSQVKTDCLFLKKPAADGNMEVQCHFERGKVIGKIDPYTITTTVPSQWAVFLQAWYSKVKTPFLFQMDSLKKRQQLLASTRKHLRTVRDDLDLKSVRRGAAQKMANAKVDLEQIRYFTRHADVSMLRRYLKFGRAESVETRKGAAAGLALSSKTS